MTTPTRNYRTKDVDMLVTASTIIENAIFNKSFLQSKRTTWADPFFDTIKAKIENAIQTYLGVDSAKDLRQATQALSGIQTQVMQDLAELKIQILEDFKNDNLRPNEILNQLGFANYHEASQNGDQEALINLLYRFKTNLTPTLKTAIITKGTAATLLDRIIGYADTLKNADVTQETYKGQRKTITAEAINEFNEIYEAVISICKIASNFYKSQPNLQAQFTYSQVAKKLNVATTQKTVIPKA